MRIKFSNPFKKKSIKPNVCSAVIVAAGSSTRMGSDKMMMEIGGLPVLLRTLQVMEQTNCID